MPPPRSDDRRRRGRARILGPGSLPRGHPCSRRIRHRARKRLVDLIRRVQFRPVCGGERHVGEDVLLGAVHQRRELGHLWAELVGDGAPLPLRSLRVGLGVGGADPGGDDAALGLARMGQGVAGEVNPASARWPGAPSPRRPSGSHGHRRSPAWPRPGRGGPGSGGSRARRAPPRRHRLPCPTPRGGHRRSRPPRW